MLLNVIRYSKATMSFFVVHVKWVLQANVVKQMLMIVKVLFVQKRIHIVSMESIHLIVNAKRISWEIVKMFVFDEILVIHRRVIRMRHVIISTMDNIVVCVHRRIQVVNVKMILMNVEFFHRFVAMVADVWMKSVRIDVFVRPDGQVQHVHKQLIIVHLNRVFEMELVWINRTVSNVNVCQHLLVTFVKMISMNVCWTNLV